MRVTKWLARPRGDDERGATAVIVTLTLIALLGMIILTVDVGQLLYKRRAMVNASDAAALAAAQSCAGLKDSDVPGAMANTFATDNVSVATGVTTTSSDAMVLPSDTSPSSIRCSRALLRGGPRLRRPGRREDRGHRRLGPAGGANPLPIVVYTGNGQGNCDIKEGIGAGVSCYLWYDNDLFNQSAFGFLNLCTDTDPCTQGWDVGAGDHCPNVGASLRKDWIDGNWTGGPNETNWPATTFVCRVSGLTSSNWSSLKNRVGDDLVFPVNDCATQVDKNGIAMGCNPSVAPDKYNIIGFIVLNLDAVLDSKAQWQGNSGTCATAPMNMVPLSPDIDLDTIAPGLGCTPYDAISNVEMKRNGNPKCCTLGVDFNYNPTTHVVDSTAPTGPP